MLQIKSDLISLSPAQRVALADFIRDFPASTTSVVTDEADDNFVTIPTFQFEDPGDDEDQGPEGADISPQEAFGITPPSTTVTLDKAGLPWDARIHSGNKAFVSDGTWRKRRGIDDATVTQVEAELKALMSVPGPAAVKVGLLEMAKTQTVYAGTDGYPVPAAPAPPAYTSESQVIPPAPVAAATAPAPSAGVTGDQKGFLALMNMASDAIIAKRMTQAELEDAAKQHGVPSIPLLATRFDLVPQVHQTVVSLLASREAA